MNNDVILHSSDDGASWVAQNLGTAKIPLAVWGSGPGDVFAVGIGGTVLHRSDPETPAQPDPVFAVFADHSLSEHTSAGWQLLSPAGTILSISAVTNAAGQDDVFAVTADSHLWEHTPAGWALLSVGSFQQISAATNLSGNAVVFAVPTDNSLWEYSSLNAGGWALLSPAGTILSISAVTDASGNDDVFAVTADTHLWEHTPSGWMMLSVGSFQQISAGLNGAGQAVLYGVLGPGPAPTTTPCGSTTRPSTSALTWLCCPPAAPS